MGRKWSSTDHSLLGPFPLSSLHHTVTSANIVQIFENSGSFLASACSLNTRLSAIPTIYDSLTLVGINSLTAPRLLSVYDKVHLTAVG